MRLYLVSQFKLSVVLPRSRVRILHAANGRQLSDRFGPGSTSSRVNELRGHEHHMQLPGSTEVDEFRGQRVQRSWSRGQRAL